MISVEEAIERVKKNSFSLNDWEWRPVQEALDYKLYEDVFSPINMPPFRQSAMDGYALFVHDTSEYTIVDELKAGDGHHPVLKAGEAVRIFTGAAVPDTANAVVMQEKTLVEGQVLQIQKVVREGENIRPKGEQIKQGVLIEHAGTRINAATVGYLTTLGITKIKVYKKPSIAIVVTGNELVKPGEPLQYGEIYESNSFMLMAAFQAIGFHDVKLHQVKDDYQATKMVLDETIQSSDLLIISGGISVGDYDFVGKALADLEVREHFYKVKQKPGKPLFYGQKNNCSIFALPGNPAAALSCFYIYVCTALNMMSPNRNTALKRTTAKTKSSISKVGDRAQFLKAFLENGEVEVLNSQSSAMLSSFSRANALVYLPENYKEIAKDDTVEVICLPNH